MTAFDSSELLEIIKNKKVKSIISCFDQDDVLVPGVPLCAGCSVELALRFSLKILGKDVILFTTPGCAASALVTKGLEPTVKARTFGCLLTNVPSIMTGVKRYFDKKGKDVNCVAFVGDGCTADVGFQPLSGAAERNENIIYICYDNEAYMNTGNQRSGTTPKGAWTTTTTPGMVQQGKRNGAKDLPLILAWHGISYVATATVAFQKDFAKKLQKAKGVKQGMSYIHLLTPCPVGWRFETEKVLELSRLAVRSNYFPLWEMENGQFRLTCETAHPKSIREFVKLQGRFSHVSERFLDEFQTSVNNKFATIKALTRISDL